MFTPAVHTTHIAIPQPPGRAVEFSGDGWDVYRHLFTALPEGYRPTFFSSIPSQSEFGFLNEKG